MGNRKAIIVSGRATLHGSYQPHETISTQGESMMFRCPSTQFEESNPMTSSGKKVMSSMKKEYGSKKGKNVFYATMKKKGMGSKWHK